MKELLKKPLAAFGSIGIAIVTCVVLYQNCSPAKYKGNSKKITSTEVKYYWIPEAWSDCIAGSQQRTMQCYDGSTGEVTDNRNCEKSDNIVLERDCSAVVMRTFVQETPENHDKVDIFLIIDDSSSMKADQLKLAERFGGFAQDLVDSGVDWQVCFTLTDTDYYNGWPLNWFGSNHFILNAETTNFQQVFSDKLRNISSGYSNDEQGIKAANLAVEKNEQHNCFRANAALSVILISDEDERSVGGVQSLSSVQYKALGELNTPQSFMDKVKNTLGVNKRFNFNSIVVKDTACKNTQTSQGSPGFIGQKYMELSNLSGGYAGSICDNDYTQNLRFFQEKIVHQLSSVQLECAAKSDSLEVYVTPSLGELSYTLSGRELTFTTIIPGEHKLVVSYACN